MLERGGRYPSVSGLRALGRFWARRALGIAGILEVRGRVFLMAHKWHLVIIHQMFGSCTFRYVLRVADTANIENKKGLNILPHLNCGKR